MKSISQICDELKNVKDFRRNVYNLITTCGVKQFTVTIGGSYALKYFCPEFEDRDIHDYDLIVRAPEEEMAVIKNFFAAIYEVIPMCRSLSSYGDGYSIGNICGKPVEILFNSDEFQPKIPMGISNINEVWETPEQILKVKKKWCDSFIQRGKAPRQKDADDIIKIEEYLGPLPF